MRLLRSVKHGGAGWLVGGVGLALGLALAVPGAATPGTIHALMAGADGGSTPTTVSTPTRGTPTTSTTGTGSGHHGTEPPPSPPTTVYHSTSAPSTSAPTTSAPTPPAGPSGSTPSSVSGQGSTGPAPDCTTAQITGLRITAIDGGHAIVVTVLVSGHVGWMSAAADGFGAATLSPIPGGWRGTITGSEPITLGTRIVVGTCDGRLQARTHFGGTGTTPGGAGDTSGGTTTTGGATPPAGGEPTTTEPPTTIVSTRSDLPVACATAAITSVTAVLGGGGHAVTVTVLMTPGVGWMSGYANGVGGITLAPVSGGFQGTLTSDTPIPPGTTVVVGTCGGRLRATATVGAAANPT